MTHERYPSKSKRWQRRLKIPFALSILALLMLAFVLRAFHSGRSPQSVAPLAAAITPTPDGFTEVRFEFGRGFIGAGWQLYFNEPDASVDRADYANGIDTALAAAIDQATGTLDIAAFELNNDLIYSAIARAHDRGVAVRIVTDDDHGLQDTSDPHLRSLNQAGIAVVEDGRSGLMHNKFIIIDNQTVWTGSWNFTVNGTYRNNNNVLALHSTAAASAYQAEFDEMFERTEYGSSSSDDGIVSFEHADGEINIIFAPEGDEISALIAEIARAEHSIRFMTFVFSLEELAEAMLNQAASHALAIEGVFEDRNSTASWSQLPALHCAGAAIRQDGNRYILHHKVIIIDENTVITGSFNFSRSAAERNDENIVIVRNAVIAGLYLEEWQRIWDSAQELAPDEVVCD